MAETDFKEAPVGWEQTVDIVKVDQARRLVFGFGYVSKFAGEQVSDHSGDEVDIDNLEEVAYDFVMNFAETGEMHQGVAKGHLVESFVVTEDKVAAIEKITGEKIPKALVGSWWNGFYMEEPGEGQPDPYQKVIDGTYKMFSIQGIGIRS